MALERITLKAARVNAGYNQEQLAQMLGVAQATISNWENGRTFPNCLELEKISFILQVDKNDIFFSDSTV